MLELSMVLGVGFGVMGIGLFELTGFGSSLEQPTVSEQTIKSAPNNSAPVFFPQVMDLRDSEILFSAILLAELKQLIRVMVGHLLLLSSASDSAGGVPSGRALILLGLGRGSAAEVVERETRRACCDTFDVA
ncbi:MAG: hypothetical protein WAN60_15760 [Candidatus Sulfotelmatobacter sp.]